VRLDDVSAFVLDVDGTLVHRTGEAIHVQPGAVDLLERIRASGRSLALFTNGSHVPPEALAEELRVAGLHVTDDEMLTPLRSVQVHLRSLEPDVAVLLFGTPAAREYLARLGLSILDAEGAEHADAVFVAHTNVVDFPQLERAARAVLAGAPLLTGSFVPAYAGADGPIFSRGAMLTAAIAKVTGARPVVVGKPSRAALRTISNQVGAPSRDLVVIGDDLDLDIALGRLGRARTILVRSGISGSIDLDRLPERQRPDAVVDGVAELLDWL
jgi:HAD superfamily hydrolase (TIGR01450 family)